MKNKPEKRVPAIVCVMPKGFDDRTRLCVIGGNKPGQYGMLVACHPVQVPVLIDMDAGTVTAIEPAN